MLLGLIFNIHTIQLCSLQPIDSFESTSLQLPPIAKPIDVDSLVRLFKRPGQNFTDVGSEG